MKPLPHVPLPLATTSAFTAGRAYGAPHAGGWQSALQRALGTTPGTAAAAMHPAPREHDAQGGPPHARQSSPSTALPVAAAGAAAIHTGAPAAPHSMAAGALPARAPLTLAGASFPTVPTAPELVPGSHALADEETASHRPAAGARPRTPAERPAVRVHLEHSADGLCVWLGLDADAAAVRLQGAAVLLELQRALPAPGTRLARVVCNGAPIYTAPHLEKETS